jgi:hypothetical protein
MHGNASNKPVDTGMDAATAVSIGNRWEQMAVVASLPNFVKRGA